MGRLSLAWMGKDQALATAPDGSYEWVDRNDPRVAEVRLLETVATVGDAAGSADDNMVVIGDGLDMLQSLVRLPEYARHYRGKVRLVYIDPPFNTGQAFEHYDDGLEHSVWLTLIRDRLMLIRDLLAPNGSVWVHLDDAEMSYCRVLMDEIFGRSNFVATVIWQKLHARNNSAQHFSTDHDYLLVFARERQSWFRHRLDRTDASDSDFWNPDDDPRGRWRRSDLTASHAYADGKYEVVGPHGDRFAPRENRWWSVSRETFVDLEANNRIWWGRKGRTFPFRKRFENELPGLVPTTVWLDEDVGNNREAKQEITRLFDRSAIFSTPKPERLLERVIHISTDPGDVVLDCFGGSGTTAAVAHKMGRRWVIGERERSTVETFLRPRLEKVVKGNDPGGVTDKTGWTGGGGFHVAATAPSMFTVAEGRVFLADGTTNGRFAEGVRAQLGFEADDNAPFCGRRGRMRLAVVDGVVDESIIRALVARAGEDRLTIVGKGSTDGAAGLLRQLSPGSRLRKAPQDLFRQKRR